ncbi:MAG: sulfotransferase family protein [Nocardioidaceae bacterium]
MTGRLPDFIIGGAPRSGTTWLATTLDRHPAIWMAKPLRPEPKFFLVEELYAAGLDEYSARWFAEAPDDAVVGEKSTNYLESGSAARRIAADLPDVRMIFLLRDPVERAISNYRWSVMNGMETEDLETALELEDRREAALVPELRYARPHAYVSRGQYAELLRPFYDHLPSEQILVLRFEDLTVVPGSTTAHAHDFLGVEARPDLAGPLEGFNASTVSVEVDPDTIARLRSHYEPLNRELAALVGPSFVPWTYEESSL